MGITADFYALKHLHSMEVKDELDEAAAAKFNSHETTDVVEQVYDVRQKKRKDDKLKRVKVKFA